MQEQTGDELYKEDVNYFDRGHMVRRKDPCWGEDYEYNAGNLDSMYFTNVAPQYYKVNQVCLQRIIIDITTLLHLFQFLGIWDLGTSSNAMTTQRTKNRRPPFNRVETFS